MPLTPPSASAAATPPALSAPESSHARAVASSVESADRRKMPTQPRPCSAGSSNSVRHSAASAAGTRRPQLSASVAAPSGSPKHAPRGVFIVSVSGASPSSSSARAEPPTHTSAVMARDQRSHCSSRSAALPHACSSIDVVDEPLLSEQSRPRSCSVKRRRSLPRTTAATHRIGTTPSGVRSRIEL